jgi:hypothetical protein
MTDNILLKNYYDMTFIYSVLSDLSFNFYSNIYNISLLPTILGSSILTILNSSNINDDYLKIINITINGLNTVVLALVNSYKINERISTFKNMKTKFTKLNHQLESLINSNNKDNDINVIITEYDRLTDELIFQFPNHIKKKVIKKYGGSRKLPNSLDVELNISQIVNII